MQNSLDLTSKQKEVVEKVTKDLRGSGSIAARLSVHKFGPVDELHIDVKRLTLFIGKNNTGKSSVAKLLAIFKGLLSYTLTYQGFIERLDDYDIGSFLCERTEISWISLFGAIFIKNGKLYSDVYGLGLDKDSLVTYSAISSLVEQEDSFRKMLDKAKGNEHKLTSEHLEVIDQVKSLLDIIDLTESKAKAINDLKDRIDVLYVPAEREFVSIATNAVFSLIESGIPLPASLIQFLSKFEKARAKNKLVEVDFLGISYAHIENEDRVIYSGSQYVLLNKASSGIKALIPAYVTLSDYRNREDSFVVFEEPESNLHPVAQKGVVNDLSSFCISLDFLKLLTVTTHSPYVLAAFNNLIQAGTLAEERPELSDDIEAIIPKESWVKFEDVSAYVLEDGSARSILDDEWKGIIAEEIDKASDEIGDEYERLLDLRYKSEVAE